MNADFLAQYIGIVTPEAWRSCFAPSMEAYRPDWLDKLDFTNILDYYEFPKGYYYERLEKELALLSRDATLNKVCWLMHYILFYADASARKAIYAWGSHFVHCTLVRLGRLMYEYRPDKHPEYQALFADRICPIELHIPSADNGLQDAEVEASIVLAPGKGGCCRPAGGHPPAEGSEETAAGRSPAAKRKGLLRALNSRIGEILCL